MLIPFEGEDEAVRLANDVRYGHAAGIWTSDASRAHRVAHALEAGSIWVNHYSAYPSEAPFGGYKESGTGHDLGLESLDEYLETKNVHVDIGHETLRLVCGITPYQPARAVFPGVGAGPVRPGTANSKR